MSKVRRVDYYPDEMVAGVAGKMSPADFGVYWMVCTLIASRGEAVDDDAEWLAGLFKRRTKKSDVRASLDRLIAEAKLQQSDGKLTQNRMLSEVNKASDRIAKSSESGAKGGRPSKKNNAIEKGSGSESEKPPATTNHQPPTTIENTAAADARTKPVRPADLEKPKPAQRSVASPEQDLIETFDALQAEIYGDSARNPWPAATDHPTARSWLDAAKEREAPTDAIHNALRACLMRWHGQGRPAPKALSVFSDEVGRALAASGQVLDIPAFLRRQSDGKSTRQSPQQRMHAGFAAAANRAEPGSDVSDN